MKYCLGSETDLLYNRHLDQLVLCTIYGVCKIQSSKMLKPVKFNEIISKYKKLQQKLKGISVQSFHEMYTQVRLENGQKGNIIEFYNKIYIQQMKVHIMSLDPRNNNKTSVSPRPKIWALAPKSPLRENLPPAYLTYSTIYSSKGKIIILNLFMIIKILFSRISSISRPYDSWNETNSNDGYDS